MLRIRSELAGNKGIRPLGFRWASGALARTLRIGLGREMSLGELAWDLVVKKRSKYRLGDEESVSRRA